MSETQKEQAPVRIGWATTDITPTEPVDVRGQFHARISEETLDPLTATVLVLDSGPELAVFVSCDVASISDALVMAVNEQLGGLFPPEKLIFNATHTHTGPALTFGRFGEDKTLARGIELPVQDTKKTVAFVAERIAGAVREAWESRAPGAIAFGLGNAIVSRNRRWVDTSGKSTMYRRIDHENFSHIEGYEDHDVNVLATYDPQGNLTGLVVNVASPSQVREQRFAISADFWHETRLELRARFGKDLPVLAQCSAAGDQAPFRVQENVYNHRAEERMLQLKKRDACTEIAHRLADAIGEVLPWIHPTRESSPVLRHSVLDLKLPLNQLTEKDADEAKLEAAKHRELFEAAKRELEENPELRKQPRWYREVTRLHGHMRRQERVVERFDRLKTEPELAVAIHVLRIGDVALATNPFEYYLDFGIQIKARSPAVQTFLVQLCGGGSYVPSRRSVAGGGYGSVPGSNIFGPDAGDKLRETTLEELKKLWENQRAEATTIVPNPH